MRAGIYARQSIDHAEGAADQERRARVIIEARAWTFVRAYVDNDVSAAKARGAGTAWARMLADLDAGTIEAVVAVDLDRLLRSTRDLNVLIDRGAKVVTVDGEIDLSTADGNFRATMLAAIAQFEISRKRERNLRANERRAASGTYRNGPRPYGYADDHYALHPAEAPLLREAYARILTGETLYAIAQDWNRREIPTHRRSAGWSTPALKALLLRPRNVGRVVLRGEVQEGVTGAWEPLIDIDTYEAVRARLTDPARRTAPKGRKPKYLAGGIATCGVCGRPMRSSVGGGGTAAYRCRVDQDLGAPRGESHATAPVVLVDNQLRDAVYEALRDAPEDAPADPEADALVDLRRERLDVLRRRQVTQELELEPDADRAHLSTLRKQLAARLTEIETRIADLEAASALDSARNIVRAASGHLRELAALQRPWSPDDVTGSLDLAGAWNAYWESLDIERRRDLIRGTLDIVINPARLSAKPPRREIRASQAGPGVELVEVSPGRPGLNRVQITPRKGAAS